MVPLALKVRAPAADRIFRCRSRPRRFAPRPLPVDNFQTAPSDLLRNSFLSTTTIKKASLKEAFFMVPLARIGLATPSLPMTCSTTELQRRQLKVNIHILKIKIKHIF